MSEETIVAIIPKNSMDEIRVRWSEYKGHRYLDLRIFTEIEGRADKTRPRRASPCGRT